MLMKTCLGPEEIGPLSAKALTQRSEHVRFGGARDNDNCEEFWQILILLCESSGSGCHIAVLLQGMNNNI